MKMDKIKTEIKKLYQNSESECMRAWFFENHVLVVAKYAEIVAKSSKADAEIVVLGALFHDVARAWGINKEPDLMQESLNKAAEIMQKYGYNKNQIEAVQESIRFHGCRAAIPKTKEGKALATADALAHLMTDFYLIFGFKQWNSPDFETYRKWASSKIERDFHKKIFFPEYKKMAKKRYEALKLIFSN